MLICKNDKYLAAVESRDNQEQLGNDAYAPLQQDEQPNGFTTKCTEVCGVILVGKSCSKICLANLYSYGRLETKVKTHVVIDKQRNSSRAILELFDCLKL